MEHRFENRYRSWCLAKDIARTQLWQHRTRLLVADHEDLLQTLFVLEGPSTVPCGIPKEFSPDNLWLWQDYLKAYHLHIFAVADTHLSIGIHDLSEPTLASDPGSDCDTDTATSVSI